MNEVLECIKNRRSIRSYLPKQIKDKELEIILDAAIHAPTAQNDQPWHFTVIQNKNFIDMVETEAKKVIEQDKELMDKINLQAKKLVGNMETKTGTSLIMDVFHDPPTLIVVSGRENAKSPLIDCSAATQNMLLAAESMDIGSCWLGSGRFFFQNNENVAKLNLPNGYEPYYIIALGYKKSQYNEAHEINKNVVNYIK